VRGLLSVSVAAAGLAGVAVTGSASAGEALDRIEARNTLTVCADPYIYPASDASSGPGGYDIEIINAIAEKQGWRVEMKWPDTGTRGGLGKALRNSIGKGECQVFMGIGVSADEADEMEEKHLVYTAPYMSVGYVLVVQGPSSDAHSIEDLKNTQIGVPMSTPIDGYLFDAGYDRELYLGNKRVVQGLIKDEINAAMLWSSYIAVARRDYPDRQFKIAPGYKPNKDLLWDYAAVVPAGEPELLQRINASLNEMLQDGTVKKIVESYNMPYFPPSTMPEMESGAVESAEEIQVAQADTADADAEEEMANPLQGDPAAIAHGEERYAARCAYCHGGHGLGAKGPNLIDNKWKFGSKLDDIFYHIAAGIPNTQMGAFGGTLSGDDIWSIIAYLQDENRKYNEKLAAEGKTK